MNDKEYFDLLRQYDIFRVKLVMRYLGIVVVFCLLFIASLMVIFLPDWSIIFSSLTSGR